ncbi:hypothetical protein [Thermoactinospora rubra]|uniref:hypothetical protein n=1 Tax=Thermoactinospora rubra TaxID=1088767 RepID=UPI000A11396F|nr:hypothetical protein [Thermoactinospora rubra]
MAATEMVLAGLAVGVAAAVVAWRGLARARLLAEARRHRSALQSWSGTARYWFDRERESWSPEPGAAMAAKLEELDRRRSEIVALRPGDPALGEAASRLGRAYESFGALARALSECETAASKPRPDIDDLLAVPPADPASTRRPQPPGRAAKPGKAARSSGGRCGGRGGGNPPGPAAVARLGARLEELDERRTRLVQRIRDSSPDTWAKLAGSATALAADYKRLSADATRAWELMFPDRAAARAAEDSALFQHILDDIRRRSQASRRAAPPRPDRTRGRTPREDHIPGEDSGDDRRGADL